MEKEDGISGGGIADSQNVTTSENLIVAYLLLGFKLISTVITILMAGWIIVTIKITKSLHKTYNVYVAHLLANDVTLILTGSISSVIMTIGYLTGHDLIPCNVLMFLSLQISNLFLTSLMISVDKVIAIAYPLRYQQIMKPRIVFGSIVAIWMTSVTFNVQHLFNTTGFIKVTKYGVCYFKDFGIDSNFMSNVLVPFLASVTALILDVYLTCKAYQIHKQIEEQNKLSGGNSRQLEILKKNQANITKHLKPMITLSIVMLAGSLLGILLFPLYTLTALVDDTLTYEDFLHQLLMPIAGYITILLHPLIYGVYFKQVREPMMSLLKCVTSSCKLKSATVTPFPQSGRHRMAWV